MTLGDFLDMWTRSNLPVLICDTMSYDDMFDKIDAINDCNNVSVESIKEYVRASFTPYHNQYKAKMYIRDEFVNAEVTRFYVCPTAMVVWVMLKEENNDFE